MNILVDLRKLSLHPSGIGIYTYEFIIAAMDICKNISSDFYNKINFIGVTDVLESDEIRKLKSLGINIFAYGSPVNKNIEVFRYFKFIKKKIKDVKPDIFWEPNNIIPININNPYGKVITTIHDIFPITSKENYNLIYKLYFGACIRKTIKMSDAIIYVSNFTKNQVESKYKFASNKFNYISYNIVDSDFIENVNVDKDYFLYIGNIERRKGVDILIKAFNLYKMEGGKNKLFIAGSLRDSSIKSMIDDSDAIEYKGYITKEEKETLLKECNAFIFPSRAEGFGIPPLEAISYNKDCILSDIDVFKEVFSNYVNYFEFCLDDQKSAEALKNQLFNFKKIKNKRELLKSYSKETLGVKFLDFLNNLSMERLKND